MGGKPKKKLSTESLDAALASDAWWNCTDAEGPLTVQARALELWRTRAEHSRDIATSLPLVSGSLRNQTAVGGPPTGRTVSGVDRPFANQAAPTCGDWPSRVIVRCWARRSTTGWRPGHPSG